MCNLLLILHIYKAEHSTAPTLTVPTLPNSRSVSVVVKLSSVANSVAASSVKLKQEGCRRPPSFTIWALKTLRTVLREKALPLAGTLLVKMTFSLRSLSWIVTSPAGMAIGAGVATTREVRRVAEAMVKRLNCMVMVLFVVGFERWV